MLIHRIKNLAQYQTHWLSQERVRKQRMNHLTELENASGGGKFSVNGFSITAGENVDFAIDWVHSNGKNINWRERMICPNTNLNNRQRGSYHVCLAELDLYQTDKIYLSEQVTPFFKFLKSKYPSLIGSEFISQETKPGKVNRSRIRHEDLTNLSFKSGSIDKVISLDCLEHIPDYKTALKETHRVLSPNGVAVYSFPFDRSVEETLVRASISSDGSINHYCEPEYHGDPFQKGGCLSYYTFGWDVLETLRCIGFKEVYAAVYWSDFFGYLGDEHIIFIAKKEGTSN